MGEAAQKRQRLIDAYARVRKEYGHREDPYIGKTIPPGSLVQLSLELLGTYFIWNDAEEIEKALVDGDYLRRWYVPATTHCRLYRALEVIITPHQQAMICFRQHLEPNFVPVSPES